MRFTGEKSVLLGMVESPYRKVESVLNQKDRVSKQTWSFKSKKRIKKKQSLAMIHEAAFRDGDVLSLSTIQEAKDKTPCIQNSAYSFKSMTIKVNTTRILLKNKKTVSRRVLAHKKGEKST